MSFRTGIQNGKGQLGCPTDLYHQLRWVPDVIRFSKS